MNSSILLKKIEDNIDNIFEEEKYKKFMQLAGRFHNYSFSNQLLIQLQNPEAFKVESDNTWKEKFNRQVKLGEKGISILAPMSVNYYVVKANGRVVKSSEITKDELKQSIDAQLVERVKRDKGYIGITVYDVSQTEGNEIDDETPGLKGYYSDTDKLFKALESATKVAIDRTKDAKTAILESSKRIAKEYMASGDIYENKENGQDTDNTKIMELRKDDEKVIIESSAYIVMSELGMDTSECSFSYITNWATNCRSTADGRQNILSLLNYTRKAADTILSAIEIEFGMTKEQSEEENESTIKEELADDLLTTMEANNVRMRALGGAV